MSANSRIQWLHRKICDMSYPNAKRLAERFGISHRQAQRDVDFLRDKLSAPIEYNYEKKGFYYSSEYTLPIEATTINDENYTGVIAAASDETINTPRAESTVIQLQIPYSAEIRISDKLSVIELQPFIREKSGVDTYICDFHSIEKFMSIILSLESDITITKPAWLRRRIVRAAERIIRNNKINDEN